MRTKLQLSGPSRILLDSTELAGLLGIGRSSIYKLRSGGKLPAPIRLGGRCLWSRSEIERWIEVGAPTREKWEALRDRPR